jgi:alkylhydroperoxidase/carboxymuconolactone decarboxylase family protein YurZ
VKFMKTIPAKQYLKIKERHPDFLSAVESLGKTIKKEGPIDEKTAHLIQLAAAATIRSEGAVHSHTRRAIDAGAHTDEIYHALILLTSTIGFPTVVAALSWAEDVIESS